VNDDQEKNPKMGNANLPVAMNRQQAEVFTLLLGLPRRDSKMSAGHKGFQIEVDPDIDPKVAAGRRDFTINALAFDPRMAGRISAKLWVTYTPCSNKPRMQNAYSGECSAS
jgi:hypothetical protein